MSLPVVVVVFVAFAAFGMVAALSANIVRSGLRLAREVKAFANEMMPAVQLLAEEGDRAARKAGELADKASRLRS